MRNVPAAPDDDAPGAASRRPGRPRRADIETRVLDAVVTLIDEGTPVSVTAIVEHSGVSRAAVYRRWNTITSLVAAALDRGRASSHGLDDMPIREALEQGAANSANDVLAGYPESRLRHRLQLGLADRALQREYWRSHVARRRAPLTVALERARATGELRSDVDLDAVQDLLAGVSYYQLVVRGERLDDPAVLARCRAANEIVWRGIRDAEG